ncbi:MAG: Asp-tRNA(Asn)/Glu-tRNA(Gln) amidotransferase subunit GatB [Clostridia bacterium]|nr:Asp-tRNA(Asn)/Glu-tRNA(Gln) amidotransferase subunit GatB [Clostridia bacterium]
MKYDIVIGLEVHSELKTQTKAFCSCKNEFGGQPNTHCCPICLGLPGALPTTNKTALEYTIKAGLAFNCKINNQAVFERKNYFYPDLSKAYQISQLEKPSCVNGYVTIDTLSGEKNIRINNIHMEEDAGKNIHDDFAGVSLVDFNRCGVPLIEIVSEPDLSSADEAVSYLEQIKESLVYIGVTDGKMQEGSLRCDVNVSLKPEGSKILGNRTEMKNLNSFKAVKRAIDYEVERQAKILDNDGRITQETRRWDDAKEESTSMRGKENSQDYRYFADRDLMPIIVEDDYVLEIAKNMPMLPRARRQYYINKLSLPEYDANVLTQDKIVSDYFDECLKILNEPKLVSNFVMSNVLRLSKSNLTPDIIEIRITPENLCDIIIMANNNVIISSGAKTLFEECWNSSKTPKVLVKELGLEQVSDESELLKTVTDIIEANPQAVQDFKKGNKKAITFFMGQVMKATRGKANPEVIKKIINQQLNI